MCAITRLQACCGKHALQACTFTHSQYTEHRVIQCTVKHFACAFQNNLFILVIALLHDEKAILLLQYIRQSVQRT
jgi:hypothetical protein